jgi:hypothetical protein
MALAVNGSGTIFKKCDRSNHRPDSNKGCASSTCQHTCDNPERCPHAWTLRYWVNGKQVEKSFKDKQHPSTGRVDYGSGRKLARDWQLKLAVDKRSGDFAGEAVRARGHDAGRIGVLPTWTRADAVNERPHHGGYHGHMACCPFPLVARL